MDEGSLGGVGCAGVVGEGRVRGWGREGGRGVLEDEAEGAVSR